MSTPFCIYMSERGLLMASKYSEEILKEASNIKQTCHKNNTTTNWIRIAERFDIENPENLRCAVKAYEKRNGILKSIDTELSDGIEEKKEIAKKRIDNSILNEYIRKQAKKEIILDSIQDYIKDLKPIQVPPFKTIKKSGITAIGAFADVHYGKDILIQDLFGNVINEYNEFVFEDRMWDLLNHYVSKKDMFDISNIVILDLGDSIEGILRLNSLQVIKYGIVESVIKYSNFMIAWLNKLSEHFNVEFYNCLGNHDEIRPLGSKSGDFPKENIGYLIEELLKKGLQNNKRVNINPAKHIHYIDIDGFRVLATHGQEEKNLIHSIKDYKEIYDIKIDLMITGHLHNSRQETASLHTKVIQLSSIAGVDDFAMSLKRSAKAEGKMILKYGSELIFVDIELN